MGYAIMKPRWHSKVGIPGEEYFTPKETDGWTVNQPSPDDNSPTIPDNSWTDAFQVLGELNNQQLSITFPNDKTLNYDPILDIELSDVLDGVEYTGELKFTQKVYKVDESTGGIDIQLSPNGEYDSATVIIVDNDHPNHNNDLEPPPNNDFANSIALSGSQITTTGSNTMASSEAGEPDHSDFDNNWGASAWWSWTAPESGLAIIDTRGSTFNTELGVYAGSSVSDLLAVPTLGEYTSSATYGEVSADTEQVLFEAVAGTTYHIAVDGQDNYFGSEAEWGLSGYIELGIVQEQPNLTIIQQGSGPTIISDFGGVGKGNKPSKDVISQVDALKFVGNGAELTAENMLLTQQGDDLIISFEKVSNTEAVLDNFALENLDNLSVENGASVTIGNILFAGDTTIQDSFDVIKANGNTSQVPRQDNVIFLNDLVNTTSGLNDSDDVINAQGGNDILSGLSGNDTLRGGAGDDSLNGGAGYDTLRGNEGTDTLDGGTGSDSLEGGEGDDSLSGGEGSDYSLYGGEGNDSINGGAGYDDLSGNAGDDILNGFGSGTEIDNLSGDDGADTFVLGDASGAYYQGSGAKSSYAAISDFNWTQGDKFQVFGSANDYTLDPSPPLGIFDIYYQGKQIGAVNNTTDVDIARDFIFV